LCGLCGVLVMSLPIPIMQDKKATLVAQTWMIQFGRLTYFTSKKELP
jgi:hypothetical protein